MADPTQKSSGDKPIEQPVLRKQKSWHYHWPVWSLFAVLLVVVVIAAAVFHIHRRSELAYGGPKPGRFVGSAFNSRGPMRIGHMPVGYRGITSKITAISGNNLTVSSTNGVTQTVVVSANTFIEKSGAPIKVTDLKVNDSLFIDGTPNDQGQILAKSIVVQ